MEAHICSALPMEAKWMLLTGGEIESIEGYGRCVSKLIEQRLDSTTRDMDSMPVMHSNVVDQTGQCSVAKVGT